MAEVEEGRDFISCRVPEECGPPHDDDNVLRKDDHDTVFGAVLAVHACKVNRVVER